MRHDRLVRLRTELEEQHLRNLKTDGDGRILNPPALGGSPVLESPARWRITAAAEVGTQHTCLTEVLAGVPPELKRQLKQETEQVPGTTAVP